MKNQRKNHSILKVTLVILTLIFITVGCENTLTNSSDAETQSSDPNKYLNAVREFADNVLEYGRDTYGPKHTLLFVDGLNVNTHEPVKWISPKGDLSQTLETEEWILSNLTSQQTLLRTLDGLSSLTGDPKYRDAAKEAIKYAFENLRTPNGLLYWGGITAYDAQGDTICGDKESLCIKQDFPYYELFWSVDQEATKKLIEATWSAYILDWSNLDLNRITELNDQLEESWNYTYEGGPVFFKSRISWARGFISTATSLMHSGVILSSLSDKKEPILWSKRLAKRFVDTRHPTTGISAHMYNQGQIELDEHTQGYYRLVQVFPGDSKTTLRRYYPESGQAQPWMSFFFMGDVLGEKGQEFVQWGLEELTAWGKVSYRKEDNSFVPMLMDGTSLEGHVWENGFGESSGYNVVKPYPADLSFFWAYSLAYSRTGDNFMWEIARNIAIGNGLGDIGSEPTANPDLDFDSLSDHPYGIFGLLELYRLTAQQAYLR